VNCAFAFGASEAGKPDTEYGEPEAFGLIFWIETVDVPVLVILRFKVLGVPLSTEPKFNVSEEKLIVIGLLPAEGGLLLQLKRKFVMSKRQMRALIFIDSMGLREKIDSIRIISAIYNPYITKSLPNC
jgi:hypothetical protein